MSRSIELSAPAEDLWSLIGDFCDIEDWHPSVSACSLKVSDGAPVRFVTSKDGDEAVHKRTAKEAGISYTYKTARSPLPIENFTATLSIEPFEEPLIMRSARFSSEDPATEQFIAEEIETALSAIKVHFSKLGYPYLLQGKGHASQTLFGSRGRSDDGFWNASAFFRRLCPAAKRSYLY
ncbi:SRPBCC family protein [Tateyamaria sp. Alg231-49]|uniref:SRPBCC family protein n=1 Tax=Tateyamaria sp. Alg231-49 TaxID=1922219 RepID=UPI000D54B4A2|nr:SRPBCC family protein [Tateyamaria sp. Alg231-49]